MHHAIEQDVAGTTETSRELTGALTLVAPPAAIGRSGRVGESDPEAPPVDWREPHTPDGFGPRGFGVRMDTIMPRTVRHKVMQCAADLASASGWKFQADLDFETSVSPRAQQFWFAACTAYESYFGDRPDLDSELEEEGDTEAHKFKGARVEAKFKGHVFIASRAGEAVTITRDGLAIGGPATWYWDDESTIRPRGQYVDLLPDIDDSEDALSLLSRRLRSMALPS